MLPCIADDLRRGVEAYRLVGPAQHGVGSRAAARQAGQIVLQLVVPEAGPLSLWRLASTARLADLFQLLACQLAFEKPIGFEEEGQHQRTMRRSPVH